MAYSCSTTLSLGEFQDSRPRSPEMVAQLVGLHPAKVFSVVLAVLRKVSSKGFPGRWRLNPMRPNIVLVEDSTPQVNSLQIKPAFQNHP